MNSLFQDTINDWNDRVRSFTAGHAAARTGRLVLSRLRQFRLEANNIVTDVRRDLLSSVDKKHAISGSPTS